MWVSWFLPCLAQPCVPSPLRQALALGYKASGRGSCSPNHTELSREDRAKGGAHPPSVKYTGEMKVTWHRERDLCFLYENRDNKPSKNNKIGFNKSQHCHKVREIRKADIHGATFFASWLPSPGDAHRSGFLTLLPVYNVQIHPS